jgi:hypothetical protein
VAAPRTSLAAALADACRVLARLGARYALVGGLAVSARAEPRLTRDVDLAIAVPDDAAAESLVRDLTSRGYRVVASVEQTRTKRLATIRLRPPGRTALGLTIPVARASHLIVMKLLVRDDRERPQDADDIRALRGSLTARDRRDVATAIELVTSRGFAPGRDLARAWRAIARAGGRKRR